MSRRLIFVNLGLTLAGIVLVDISVAKWLVQPPTPHAYRSSTYYSAAFLEEASSIEIEMIARQEDPGSIYFQNVDKYGRWINIRDGNRVTIPESRNARHSIYVFGGSTTLCGDVPDSLTWPSQLAARLDADTYRVVNLGVAGATIMSRVERLRALESSIEPGDVLIFYFGVNESLFHREFNKPHGVFRLVPGLWGLTYQFAKFSNIGRLLLKWSQTVAIEPTVVPAEGLFRTFTHLFEAQDIAARRGASVLFVLQPNYFVQRAPDSWTAPPGTTLDPRLISEIQYFYNRVLQHSPPELRIADATQIFISLPVSPYFDWMHVNEIGNRRIAEFILDVVSVLPT